MAIWPRRSSGMAPAWNWRPAMAHCLRNMTLTMAIVQRYDQVIWYGERAVAAGEADLPVRLELGVAMLAQGRPHQAIEQLDHVIAEDARHADAHQALALAWQQLGHSERAQHHARLAAESAP